MRTYIINSNSGFSLIELLVAAGITSVVLLAGAYISADFVKKSENKNVLIFLEQQKAIIADYLANPDNVQSMINNSTDNPTLACVKNDTDCDSVRITPNYELITNRLIPRDASGNLVLNNSTLTDGYTLKGAPCNTYDRVNGNDSCPLRISLAWAPICPTSSGKCVNPEIKIVVGFGYKPQKGKLPYINTDHFSFNSYLGRKPTPISETCVSMGGTWTGNRCDLLSGGCANADEAIIGFDASNKPICKSMVASYSCDSDEFFQGVSDKGDPICGKCP